MSNCLPLGSIEPLPLVCNHELPTRHPIFTGAGSWIYRKNLAQRETIDQQLMWQASFGLTNHQLKTGEGIYSPVRTNITCPHVGGVKELCPTLWNAIQTGQLLRRLGSGRGASEPEALMLAHFRQVSVAGK